ncbi:MAG: HIT domain-containing protein [Abditibacteriales bacterium]|nr:HIT domain-containing protein [Abditibacteriales bacterium]
MELIWAPWRIGYIVSQKPQGCIFCDKPKEDRDRENLLLARAKRCTVMLNAYPYNNGHLMVAPYRHVAALTDLTEDEISDIMRVAQQCVRVLQQAFQPDGFNIGMNVGRAAGAGIDDHLHLHIVPRWTAIPTLCPC